MAVLRFISVVVAMLAAPHVFASSFDCSKAVSYAERQVCTDGYLIGIDKLLSTSYRNALNSSSEIRFLEQSQQQWLQELKECKVQKCLDQAFSARIQVLDAYTRDQVARSQQLDKEKQLAIVQAEEDERRQAFERNRQAEEIRRHQVVQRQNVSVPVSAANNSRSFAQEEGRSTYARQDSVFFAVWSNAWKYLLLISVLCSVFAVVSHHRGRSNIYYDYTDASISNVLPALGFVLAILSKWLGMPDLVYQASALTGVVLALVYTVYACIRINDSGASIALSFVARVTFIAIFYAILLLLILSFFVNTRRDYESQAQADARNRREKRQTRLQLAGVTVGYSFWTRWLCRYGEFTPLTNALDFDQV